MLVLALTFISLIAIYIYLIKPLNHWKKFNVKHTKPWPIFGDYLLNFFGKESLAHFTERIYNVADDVRYVGYFEMKDPALCIKDPELIKEIMIKDFDHFVDHRPLVDSEAEPLWGNNLLSLTGQKWKDMRTTLSPAYTSSKMKHMFGLMAQVAENLSKYLLDQNKEVIDVNLKDILSRFTNDVIATTAFGVEVNSITNRDSEFYEIGVETTQFGRFIDVARRLLFFLAPKIANVLKVGLFSKRVTNYFRGLIKDTLQARQKGNITRPDMINILMNSKTSNNDKLTLDEQTAQALIFFFAGFESVSAAMCFACYEMAINSDVQDKLRNEINQTLEENNGEITYDAIQGMKYMDMVVSETLRKWPSFASTERLCTKPYTLKPVRPGEKPIHLNLKDQILFPIYAIQRDPKYFPNPEKFDPERFSKENKDKIVPYTYIPFGGGPRVCIGNRFALLETKIVLFYLLRHFKVVPNAKSKIPLELHPRTFGVSAKGGVHFNLEKVH